MARRVMKFGGISLANKTNMRMVIQHILREHQQGHEIVVVTSAQAGVTNQLLESINMLTTKCDKAEADVVLSAGEQITAGLLALLLRQEGVQTSSWMGWQVPIQTNEDHGSADILHIETPMIESLLLRGYIPIVAGFQGITSQGRITTLGRGGSDLTATALASFLKADTCDFYKDVDGLYTADPQLVKGARKLKAVNYHTLLKISQLGCRIIAPKAVAWASTHRVPLRIFSFLNEKLEGTVVHEQVCSPASLKMILTADHQEKAHAEVCPLYILDDSKISRHLKQVIEKLSFQKGMVTLKEKIAILNVPFAQLATTAQILHEAIWETETCPATVN